MVRCETQQSAWPDVEQGIVSSGMSRKHFAAVIPVPVSILTGCREDRADCYTVLPSVYMTVSMSCIRSIAVGRCPPTDAAGQPCFSDDPFYLVAGSYDGTTVLVDMRDPAFPVDINRARCRSCLPG